MRNQNPTADTLDRLAKAIMEKHHVGYAEACALLDSFKLNLVCDESIADSVALQAGVITAVNAGKRAFHGGVRVLMPQNTPCRVPWPGQPSLSAVVHELGGELGQPDISDKSQTLYFGHATNPVKSSFVVIASGWRGGIAAPAMQQSLPGPDFASGGVLGSSLGVARGFLRIAGLCHRELDSALGVSLWRPDLDWLAPDADGPILEVLPKRLWFLGLGHLGQAFLWNLGLLPFQSPGDVKFLLQDFDKAVKANWGSGLLCEEKSAGIQKTRLCAEWAERRDFQTVIEERAFDLNTKRAGEEPFVALCGFDSEPARSLIDDAGFDLIVECGLGADARGFDKFLLHTFPGASRSASEIWSRNEREITPARLELVEAFKTENECGILAETNARKAVSTAFVGAYTGALAIGEILRGLHGGVRCELISGQLRCNDPLEVVTHGENYAARLAQNGFVAVPGKNEIQISA